jgi:hypothetical protein
MKLLQILSVSLLLVGGCATHRQSSTADAQPQLEQTFKIVRGGSRTTEDVVGKMTPTYTIHPDLSELFPLRPTGEEKWELVAFNGCGSVQEAMNEIQRRGLERPVYEDALKFNERYSKEKGAFIFLHDPRPFHGNKVVLFVGHGPVNSVVWVRDLNTMTIAKSDWVVGARKANSGSSTP